MLDPVETRPSMQEMEVQMLKPNKEIKLDQNPTILTQPVATDPLQKLFALI